VKKYLAGLLPAAAAAAAVAAPAPVASTPITHLIVVVGENMTFDNLFATYQPAAGQRANTLLARGVIDEAGSPGPAFNSAAQWMAHQSGHYSVTPQRIRPMEVLAQPGTTNAIGLPQFVPDGRFPATLPNGPYPITRYIGFEAPVGDPVHRFFQMWQQIDGGRADLFVWVDETSGEGSQTHEDPSSATHQGAVAMGFYNMSQGDAPVLKRLAATYAISDNYHQSVMGGTGPNYLALSTGHAAAYLSAGKPSIPPPNQIEDPEPKPGSENWYRNSGYSSGSYTKCADATQPGVGAIRALLASLPYKPFRNGNCAPDTYYLVNNYEPAFSPDGRVKPLGPDKFVVPAQIEPNIGTHLAAHGVSWRWYSGGRNAHGVDKDRYCVQCDPLTHSAAIMTGPLRDNLRSLEDFEHDVGRGALPAVSFVIPTNEESGHPAYSTAAAFDGFIGKLVAEVQASQVLWAHTAILITTDEGGGNYDGGYVQFIDFFGDGTRIPLLAVSPFARAGFVDHTYADHVSILKFIEANWRLPTLSMASRDNLPNPMAGADPYIPGNRPAIGDLMGLFAFP
jgi:acid phosphatase